jgi:hypothetical protein
MNVSDNDRIASQFKDDGYTIINDVFPVGLLDRIREESMSKYNELMQLIHDKGKGAELGIGMKSGYCEIVQRQVGRYEMTHDMRDVAGMLEECEGFKRVDAVLDRAFDEKYKVIGCSLLLSTAGTKVYCHRTL